MSHEQQRPRSLPIAATPLAGDASPCRLLRTKTAFGTMQPGGPDWRAGDSTTAVYWCLRTMETFGRDGRLAHPHACARKAARSCFASERGDGGDAGDAE